MKDKIAFWGSDEQDKDILVVLRLRADDNKVDLWTFPKDGLDENFTKSIFEDWEAIDPEKFPPVFIHVEQDMSQPGLLPDNVRTKNTEVVNRAETEWYVKVLSSKLLTKLGSETEQLARQIDTCTEYDKDLWDTVQSYWDKVNQHFQARDLNREQAAVLREKINACFAKLKGLRKESNKQQEQEMLANYDRIKGMLDKFFQQISDKQNLNKVFDDLKALQSEFTKTRFTQEHRSSLYHTINEAFEAVKIERNAQRNNRFAGRIEGLKDAIAKMEKSLKIDENELKFQQDQQKNTSGKLEAQLREAKIQMILTRANSKREKINDMYATLKGLVTEMEKELGKLGSATTKVVKLKERSKKNKETASTNPDGEPQRKKQQNNNSLAAENDKRQQNDDEIVETKNRSNSDSTPESSTAAAATENTAGYIGNDNENENENGSDNDNEAILADNVPPPTENE